MEKQLQHSSPLIMPFTKKRIPGSADWNRAFKIQAVRKGQLLCTIAFKNVVGLTGLGKECCGVPNFC